MKNIIGPRGWNPATVSHRYSDSSPVPSTYDAATRTVDCVISCGSPVARFYGTEVLRISNDAVDLDRMKNGSMIPLLDSHQGTGINNALGRFTKAWITRGALMGSIAFNDTPNGNLAMGMVARGEIAGISAGYSVKEWEITDAKGNILDPEMQNIRFDYDLTFTATRWSLHEGSLVSVPADALSGIRSLGGGDRAMTSDNIEAVRSRMLIRQRMHERQSTYFGE
jgi:hypothetical protein